MLLYWGPQTHYFKNLATWRFWRHSTTSVSLRKSPQRAVNQQIKTSQKKLTCTPRPFAPVGDIKCANALELHYILRLLPSAVGRDIILSLKSSAPSPTAFLGSKERSPCKTTSSYNRSSYFLRQFSLNLYLKLLSWLQDPMLKPMNKDIRTRKEREEKVHLQVPPVTVSPPA